MESGCTHSHVPEEFLPQISTLSPGNNPDAKRYAVPGPYRQLACCKTTPSGKSKVGVRVIVGVNVIVGVDVTVDVFVVVGVEVNVDVDEDVGVWEIVYVGKLVVALLEVEEGNNMLQAWVEKETPIIINIIVIHLMDFLEILYR